MFLKVPVDLFKCLRFAKEPQDIQFTVIEEWRNQKIFTIKKVESENLSIFYWKITQTDELINNQLFIAALIPF